MSLKIKIFGWRNKNLDQISRIEEALISLGHQIVEENPDFIYSHDFTEIDKKRKNTCFTFSYKNRNIYTHRR